MRKILLTLLFVIFGLTTTFASFPISKNITSIEKVEDNIATVDSATNDTPKFGNRSLLMGLVWFPLLICSVFFAFDGNSDASALSCLIAAIASFIGAIITGIISLKRKEKPKWKAILGLGLTLGTILFSIIAPLLEDIPFY
ncbi:MAG: hypothetical protein CMD22_06135 [Flavobacteriales bacterium]|nr:hypothetical protein [Flavobacteriales bacterium]|tara:strand:- start:1244 stop:1666 length:423 start_codon:yes stop_codon:yes gene_type:complete